MSLLMDQNRERGNSLQKERKKKKGEKVVELKASKPSPFSLTFHSEWKQKAPRPLSFQGEDEFSKTAEQLTNIIFSYQDPQQTAFDSLGTSRQSWKVNYMTPNLSKSSVYRKSFYKNKPIPNVVNHDKEYMKLAGPHIDLRTNYNQDFLIREPDQLQRPKPEDLLKTGGATSTLTSYTSNFPGFRGQNQYVKPTDRETRGKFPLLARSTYHQSFGGRSAPKATTGKNKDSLKSGSIWLGQTSYGGSYHQPNPENYPTKVKNVEKLETSPRFGKQFETTYKNSFIDKKKAVETIESDAQGIQAEN